MKRWRVKGGGRGTGENGEAQIKSATETNEEPLMEIQ